MDSTTTTNTTHPHPERQHQQQDQSHSSPNAPNVEDHSNASKDAAVSTTEVHSPDTTLPSSSALIASTSGSTPQQPITVEDPKSTSTLSNLWSKSLSSITGSSKLAASHLRHRFGTPLTIVIAGETGLGKSTLINQIFGIDLAKAGAGKPVTKLARLYSDDNVRIVDTVGTAKPYINKG
ncbi:hypothetical protein HDU76_011079 [Blyttiomyces sp. JEL0837]|nr:hypothetical protein HDU76_011079 [Blyttiomyces sp. JEL0837]